MSRSALLIEKLSLAILGEDRELVVEVLACFARSVCDTSGVTVDAFAMKMRGDEGVAPPS